jgi:hypothetical protein
VPALIDLLMDPNKELRQTVATLLGRIGDTFALPVLISALKGDRHRHVRCAAAGALVEMGKQAVPALIDAMKNDRSKLVRSKAAKALCMVHEVSAMPALIDLLNSENEKMRWDVLFAFEHILKNCKSREDVQEFEDKLDDGLFRLRGKHRKIGKIKKVGFFFAKLRKKAQGMKNRLSQDKGILLDDKPKPPKKGRMYRIMSRALRRSRC